MQAALGSVIGPKKTDRDLTGRIAVVTGGALGIGYEVSRAFALNKARVIMISRKEEQGKEAIEKIQKEANGEALIEWTGCDLGNLKQVREVFQRIREKVKRVDILVLNSGVNVNQYATDEDGIDRHFGVNWLGHFYAINLLYPLIRETSKLPNTPPPRIVFNSSVMHKNAPKTVHFASLDEINNSELSPTELYGRTKLAMILGAKFGIYEKVIKPNNDNIYVLAIHPGTVATDAQDQWKDSYPGVVGEAIAAATLVVARSPEQGSYPILYAAMDPEVEKNEWNGVYLSDVAKIGDVSDQANDPSLGHALWDLSHRLVKDKLGDDAIVPWGEN